MWFGSPHLQIDRDSLKTFSTTNRTPTYFGWRRHCLPSSSSKTKTVNKNCTLKKKNMALFTAGPAITCWDRGRLVKEKNSGHWTSYSTGLGTQGLVCNLPHPVIKQKTWQSNIIGHSHFECRSKHLTEFAALPQNVKTSLKNGKSHIPGFTDSPGCATPPWPPLFSLPFPSQLAPNFPRTNNSKIRQRIHLENLDLTGEGEWRKRRGTNEAIICTAGLGLYRYAQKAYRVRFSSVRFNDMREGALFKTVSGHP